MRNSGFFFTEYPFILSGTIDELFLKNIECTDSIENRYLLFGINLIFHI